MLPITTNAPLPELQDRETLIRRFLAALDAKPTTKEVYGRAIGYYLEWLEQRRETPTRSTIVTYKETLIARKLSAFSVSLYLVAVRKFYEWAESALICPNIARGVKGSKKPRGFAKDCLTVDQARGLVDSLKAMDNLEGLRNFALVNLLLRTGIREVEAVRADVGDIRQEGGQAVLWVHGKGRDAKDAFVILTDAALEAIRAYLAARGPVRDADPLFVSESDRNKGARLSTKTVRNVAKAALRGIGLNSRRITPHSLRHTAVTLALLGGASLQDAQAMARHESITTTTIYAHNIERIGNAAERNLDAILNKVA